MYKGRVDKMFEDLNAIIVETFNLNLLVHKSDDHEITDKLIVAIVSEDKKYDHENENIAADFKLFNIGTQTKILQYFKCSYIT